jgi:hypothetical protein
VKDAIDLSTVTILNSPDVRDWPITAAITAIDCQLAGVNVAHTKRHGPDRWPDMPLDGSGGPVSFTVWFFKQIGGQWFGAAGFEFWETREHSGDSIFRVLADAFYDANRWGVLSGQAFAPGELAGFMVTAGDARPAVSDSVHERSNIVTITVPANGVGWFPFDGTPAELPAPTPAPDDDTPAWAKELTDAIDAAAQVIDGARDDYRKLIKRLDDVLEHGVKVHL